MNIDELDQLIKESLQLDEKYAELQRRMRTEMERVQRFQEKMRVILEKEAKKRGS